MFDVAHSVKEHPEAVRGCLAPLGIRQKRPPGLEGDPAQSGPMGVLNRSRPQCRHVGPLFLTGLEHLDQNTPGPGLPELRRTGEHRIRALERLDRENEIILHDASLPYIERAEPAHDGNTAPDILHRLRVRTNTALAPGMAERAVQKFMRSPDDESFLAEDPHQGAEQPVIARKQRPSYPRHEPRALGIGTKIPERRATDRPDQDDFATTGLTQCGKDLSRRGQTNDAVRPCIETRGIDEILKTDDEDRTTRIPHCLGNLEGQRPASGQNTDGRRSNRTMRQRSHTPSVSAVIWDGLAARTSPRRLSASMKAMIS